MSLSEREKASIEKRTESISESVPSGDEKIRTQVIDPAAENINAKLANPLAGIPQDQLLRDGAAFARKHNLSHLENEFAKGAIVAQDPLGFENLDILTEEEKAVLRREQTHRWSQPFTLYWLVIMCSICAAVQGMDETVINGAQEFFQVQFGMIKHALRIRTD